MEEQSVYNVSSIRVASDFSAGRLEAREFLSKAFENLNDFKPRILYITTSQSNVKLKYLFSDALDLKYSNSWSYWQKCPKPRS